MRARPKIDHFWYDLEMRLQDFNNLVPKPSQTEHNQGRIELPKAERGHATSYSARIDSIVLSVTKNNISS